MERVNEPSYSLSPPKLPKGTYDSTHWKECLLGCYLVRNGPKWQTKDTMRTLSKLYSHESNQMEALDIAVDAWTVQNSDYVRAKICEIPHPSNHVKVCYFPSATYQ